MLLKLTCYALGSIEYANVADLGFGLSDLAIRSLDMIHATTGLPWWATIIATTFAVRTAFFPITVISVRMRVWATASVCDAGH